MSAAFTPFVHHGLPSFMRATLATAAAGGSCGYEHAGFTLGRHIANQAPRDAEEDEWAEEVDRLVSFIDDDEALATWLRGTFPRILASVPARRLPQFVAGIRRAHEEELLNA
jgi:hypothetical protein